MKNFRAPYFPKEKVWAIVENFRKKHSLAKTIPVEILDLVEFDLGLELVPVSGLRERLDIEAALQGDLSGIWVDQKVFEDDRFVNRFRFSVAHEIGHLILHQNVYKKARQRYKDQEGWIKFMTSIPEDQYSFIESQAYEFAGRLLVPVDKLKAEFENQITRVDKQRRREVDKDTLFDYLAIPISKQFGVSSEVIARRLYKEGF